MEMKAATLLGTLAIIGLLGISQQSRADEAEPSVYMVNTQTHEVVSVNEAGDVTPIQDQAELKDLAQFAHENPIHLEGLTTTEASADNKMGLGIGLGIGGIGAGIHIGRGGIRVGGHVGPIGAGGGLGRGHVGVGGHVGRGRIGAGIHARRGGFWRHGHWHRGHWHRRGHRFAGDWALVATN